MKCTTNGDYMLLAENPPQMEGISCVYRGQLKDGVQVAVKRLKYGLFKDNAAFCSEVQFLARFHHKNLLPLRGYCAEGKERMLVVEYMSNSSLYAHLHGDLENEKPLDWHQRMGIARGCAEGLLYLHHGAGLELVHGNFKSSNVLLTENFEPKISDYGFLRLLNEKVAKAKTAFGYAAREDPEGEAPTKMGDTFSFGVLLLELISGKNPAEKILHGTRKLSIIEWAQQSIMEGKLNELVDARLNGNYSHVELEVLLNTAFLCAQLKPEDRLTMLEADGFLNSRPNKCGMVINEDERKLCNDPA
ncbi:hypothetical protein KP509_05G063400 [Ceratopteris richardii]|nr:hypothetical protein KP509_05G063400 [Ceratopteris richardii]